MMRYLLDIKKDVDVTAPMIRIDDIPNGYPLKDHVKAKHDRVWKRDRERIQYDERVQEFIPFIVDTIFSMYRRGFIKKEQTRNNSGLRIFKPYICRHLDWYMIPDDKLPIDQMNYLKTSKNVSHWYGSVMRSYMKKDMKHHNEISKIIRNREKKHNENVQRRKQENQKRRRNREQYRKSIVNKKLK